MFLPSHKSNLDSLVMNVALHDNGLPRTHVFGGINMAFWPMGPCSDTPARSSSGATRGGTAVYTHTLREYIGYLIEKRFSLQFYVEGGRSRTGKLLPAKLGLLAYIADAYRQGLSDDVVLVPVSIAYDQLQEVGEFARESGGASKASESIGWLVRSLPRSSGDGSARSTSASASRSRFTRRWVNRVGKSTLTPSGWRCRRWGSR